MFRETDKKFAKTDRLLTEKFQETDRRFKEIQEELDGIGKSNGEIAENFTPNEIR